VRLWTHAAKHDTNLKETDVNHEVLIDTVVPTTDADKNVMDADFPPKPVNAVNTVNEPSVTAVEPVDPVHETLAQSHLRMFYQRSYSNL
jgi:hypothetical protein